MTIFARRSVLSKQLVSSRSPHQRSHKADKMGDQVVLPMDDVLFADINWPEDGDEISPHPSTRWQPTISITGDIETGFKHSHDKSLTKKGSVSTEPSDTELTPGDNADDSSPTMGESSGAKRGSGSQAGCRFSREARSILRTWYFEHQFNPYPTSIEKDELAAKTQLKRSQITLWLANTRRKHRSRKQAEVPEKQENEVFRPMDRWKMLPIAEEAVPNGPPLILATVAATSPQAYAPAEEERAREYPRSVFDCEQSITNVSHCDTWAQSMASLETGMTSFVDSASLSDYTAFSYPSFAPSVTSQSMSQTSHDRRRRRCNTTKALKPISTKSRPFHCTFCPGQSFATKHDWQRHEKSQHLSLEKWTCCLDGGTIVSAKGVVCAFCDVVNPDTQHMELHNYSACQVKALDERTFYRKDHFQQHLRLIHDAKIHSRMDVWKTERTEIKSRCGFCNANFSTWAARADHLAAHFKCRSTMSDWSGDWGFEPHIAALVERVPQWKPLQAAPTPISVLGTQFGAKPPPPLFSQPVIPELGLTDFYPRPDIPGLLPHDNLLSYGAGYQGEGPMRQNFSTVVPGMEGIDMLDWSGFYV